MLEMLSRGPQHVQTTELSYVEQFLEWIHHHQNPLVRHITCYIKPITKNAQHMKVSIRQFLHAGGPLLNISNIKRWCTNNGAGK